MLAYTHAHTRARAHTYAGRGGLTKDPVLASQLFGKALDIGGHTANNLGILQENRAAASKEAAKQAAVAVASIDNAEMHAKCAGLVGELFFLSRGSGGGVRRTGWHRNRHTQQPLVLRTWAPSVGSSTSRSPSRRLWFGM